MIKLLQGKLTNLSSKKNSSCFSATLKREVTFQGVGLHSGKTIQLKLCPTTPFSGITFARVDLPGAPEVPAHYSFVHQTQLATTLKKGEAVVSTVEHLLAALYGAQLHSVRVEVNGPEVPILDGSADLFYQKLKQEEKQIQANRVPLLKIKKKLELSLGEKSITIQPSEKFRLIGSVYWDHPSIGHQEWTYEEGKTSFDEVASARTFGFLKDIENLKQKGLIQGGSLENAVVLDHEKVINPEGLRSPREFVQHKILDALGDFMLAGVRLQAEIHLHRAGHELHGLALKEIFENPDCFEWVEAPKKKKERSPGLPLFIPSRLPTSSWS